MFGDELRRRMAAKDLSLRELARRTRYDSGHLSKVASGKRKVSPDMAARLDAALDAGGELAALAPMPVAPPDGVTLELMAQLERSSIGPGTVDALAAAVDRLCRDYPATPAPELRAKGAACLEQVCRLLTGHTTLRQHRDLLVQAGWLALLVGCVEYDMAMTHSAEATRVMASQLGRESGHSEITAWALEMSAWFALTRRDCRAAIEAARAGREIESVHSVAVQLAAQEAKAWARLGDTRELERAMERATVLLDRIPRPDHPEHHFEVDPAKLHFYAMDCYQLSDQLPRAEAYAEEVLRLGTGPGGEDLAPMRMSEAWLTLGKVAAQQGELERAVYSGLAAFGRERTSLPSMLTSARELEAVLLTRYPHERATEEFSEQLRGQRGHGEACR